MWTDPIVAELHRLRERHARKFGYDLLEMFQDLKREQASSDRKVVSVSRERKKKQSRRLRESV
jgi:hypothetical protein